jgi:hypothetical protein
MPVTKQVKKTAKQSRVEEEKVKINTSPSQGKKSKNPEPNLEDQIAVV